MFELGRYAREEPDTPAKEVLSPLEMQVIWTYMVGAGLLPPEDIRGWVVMLARILSWQPRKRRRLSGNDVLWKAERVRTSLQSSTR